jgi:hypothetical protein
VTTTIRELLYAEPQGGYFLHPLQHRVARMDCLAIGLLYRSSPLISINPLSTRLCSPAPFLFQITLLTHFCIFCSTLPTIHGHQSHDDDRHGMPLFCPVFGIIPGLDLDGSLFLISRSRVDFSSSICYLHTCPAALSNIFFIH